MSKGLLIDPYMFCLDNDADIRNNINFFNKVIQLCNAGKIAIFVYQGLLEKINNFPINPFPIRVNEIQDLELKSQVLILNRNFLQILSAGIIGIEIVECKGEQNFKSVPDLTEDSEYFELLSVMLSKCYNQISSLEPYVLIGNIKSKMSVGACLSIECICKECNFQQKYTWCSPNVFEDEKDLAFEALRKAIEDKGSLFVQVPKVSRADHHCPLQNKKIQKYSDFTARNKRVLSLLRSFGLYKMNLTDYHEDASYIPGTIVVVKIRNGNNSEIVEGWLFCQTGFKSYIEMYFPAGVGSALCTYTDNYFCYEKIEKLKTKLGVD